MTLSKELENFYLKWGVRSLASIAFIVSYMWALIYMLTVMKPSKDFLDIYNENDDWN
jgi:hypothetical protein